MRNKLQKAQRARLIALQGQARYDKTARTRKRIADGWAPDPRSWLRSDATRQALLGDVLRSSASGGGYSVARESEGAALTVRPGQMVRIQGKNYRMP